jgi:hypothetical protein
VAVTDASRRIQANPNDIRAYAALSQCALILGQMVSDYAAITRSAEHEDMLETQAVADLSETRLTV